MSLTPTQQYLQVYNSLCSACENGDDEKVTAIVKSGIVTVYDKKIMMSACFGGNLTIMKLITKLCIKSNTKDDIEMILNECLHYSCYMGCYKVVKFLLNNGAIFADRDHYDLYGESLDTMCRYGHVKILMLVTKTNFDDWDRGLLAACRSGNKQMIKYMVSNGASNWGECLEDACLNGDIKMVKFTIKNLTVKKIAALTNGLHNACLSGHLEIVKLLIASTNRKLDWDWGLHNACLSGHVKIAKLMISKGANNWYEGFEAACRGEYGEYVEIAELMIDHGTDLNYGLITACDYNSVEIVKLVISRSKKGGGGYGFSTSTLNKALRVVSKHQKGDKIVQIINILISEGATK